MAEPAATSQGAQHKKRQRMILIGAAAAALLLLLYMRSRSSQQSANATSPTDVQGNALGAAGGGAGVAPSTFADNGANAAALGDALTNGLQQIQDQISQGQQTTAAATGATDPGAGTGGGGGSTDPGGSMGSGGGGGGMPTDPSAGSGGGTSPAGTTITTTYGPGDIISSGPGARVSVTNNNGPKATAKPGAGTKATKSTSKIAAPKKKSGGVKQPIGKPSIWKTGKTSQKQPAKKKKK